MAVSCRERTPDDAVVYGVASIGKAVTKGISKAYSRPRDKRELAIGVTAELIGFLCDFAKSYVNAPLCDPFPDYNESDERVASSYKPDLRRYRALEST